MIGAAFGKKLAGNLRMACQALGLHDDLAVPAEAEPGEAVEDGVDRFLGRAGPIGILDAQPEAAAEMPCIEPIEERSAGAPIWRKPVGEGAKRTMTDMGAAV